MDRPASLISQRNVRTTRRSHNPLLELTKGFQEFRRRWFREGSPGQDATTLGMG
jgi:hypothetical protein